MAINSIFSDNYLREQRLRFMRTHRDAFDVEPKFPLPLFEEAVLEIEGYCGVEPTCHVESDRLFAADFQVANYGHTWPISLTDAAKFLDKVESRIDVKINRQLLDQFASLYIGSRKIENNTIGIDLRPKIQDSLLKIYMHIHPGENNEDLVRTAIAIDGSTYSYEVTEVLIRDVVVIGFNLFLDGRSNVEIWAGSPGIKDEPQSSLGRYLQAYIYKNCSRELISIFNVSDFIAVSFSKQRLDPLFHFHFLDIKDIPKYFAFNSMGDNIYDFCQSQDCVTYSGVIVREQELERNRLNNYSFFYNQSDMCLSDSDIVNLMQLTAMSK